MRLRFAPIASALAVALLVGPLDGRFASAGAPSRIVILPIVVHSAAPDADYVSRGLSDMISSRLEQTGRVRVERVEDPSAATTLIGTALREGRARQGDYAIYGAFTQFGDGASLDIHCIPLDVRDEAEAEAARRIFIQSGTVGEIIPKIDAIVDRIGDCVHEGGGDAKATASGGSGAAPARQDGERPSDATLRSLNERLEALERAVFGPDSAAAARAAEPPPPES